MTTRSLCIVACTDAERACEIRNGVQAAFPGTSSTIAYGTSAAGVELREREHTCVLIDGASEPAKGQKLALDIGTSSFRWLFAGSVWKGTGKSATVVMIMPEKTPPDIHPLRGVTIIQEPITPEEIVARLGDILIPPVVAAPTLIIPAVGETRTDPAPAF